MNNSKILVWNTIKYRITEEPLTGNQFKTFSSWTLTLTEVWNALSVMFLWCVVSVDFGVQARIIWKTLPSFFLSCPKQYILRHSILKNSTNILFWDCCPRKDFFFSFNQVESFPFSHVQEQVKSRESNPVTPDSGKCFEIPRIKLLCNQSDGF